MKIFFDCEFTGLHQHTTLISIGLVSEDDRMFYGEFIDYDESQIDDWLRDNVLSHLIMHSGVNHLSVPDYVHIGNRSYIKGKLLEWFGQFERVEPWGDCLAYDWVLLSELIADRSSGYPKLPDNFAYHSPYDLLTMMRTLDIDPDWNREVLATWETEGNQKHNALWDARVIRACYERLKGDWQA